MDSKKVMEKMRQSVAALAVVFGMSGMAFGAHSHCVCGDGQCTTVGGHTHETIEWTEWTETGTLPSKAGYYFLANDVTLTETYHPADGVILCLNGKKVTKTGSTEYGAIYIDTGKTFTMCDCQGNVGNISGVAAKHGSAISAIGKFVMYGGTLRDNTATSDSPGIMIWKTDTVVGEVEIYGGVIENNTSGEYSGGIGVNVNCKLWLENCIVRGNTATAKNGGGVRCDGYATIINSVITNNTAAKEAGVSVSGNVVNNVIIGGKTIVADNHLNDAARTLNNVAFDTTIVKQTGLEVVTVHGTSPLVEGANIGVSVTREPTTESPVAVTTPCNADMSAFFSCDNYTNCGAVDSDDHTVKFAPGFPVTLVLNGDDVQCEELTKYIPGTVTQLPIPTRPNYTFGGWYTDDTQRVQKKAGATVTEIPADATGAKTFYAGWNPYVEVTIKTVEHTTITNVTVDGVSTTAVPLKVPEGSTVVVYYCADDFYVLTGDSEATLTEVSQSKKTVDASKITVESAHSHDGIVWTAWDKTTTLPNTPGNYYLTADVNLSGVYKPVSGVNICLNGMTVNQMTEGQGVIEVGANCNFTLYDCQGDAGCITGGSSDCGAGILVTGVGANFTMYGGTISNNESTDDSGGIRIKQGAVAKIYGGVIEYNTAATYSGGIGVGGQDETDGQSELWIQNCTIKNNSAGTKNGGGIRCDHAKVTIVDCVITGNKAASDAGVSVASDLVTIGGSTEISQNTLLSKGATATSSNLAFDGDKKVAVSRDYPLTSDALIGVSATIPVGESQIIVATNSAVNVQRNFRSDKPSYYACKSGDDNEVVIAKVTNPMPPNKQGIPTTIVIPDEYREQYQLTGDEIMAIDEPTTENGYPVWQSYLLGLDPRDINNQSYADSPQNPNVDEITVQAKNVNPLDGDSVKYRLDTKLASAQGYVAGDTEQESDTFAVKIDGDDPTGYYKVTMVIAHADGQGGSNEFLAETANQVGLLKQTQSVTNAIVAVPWAKLAPDGEAAITISNLLKTATLDEGDELRVYQPNSSKYAAWTLDENKQWQSMNTVSAAAGSAPTMEAAGPAYKTTVKRGSGVWLLRKEASKDKPYYLYGQYEASAPNLTLQTGSNLVGAPGIGMCDLNELYPNASTQDSIQVPGEQDVPKIFEYKNFWNGGSWGYKKSTTKEIVFGGKVYKSINNEWTAGDTEVKPGTGFWYIKK